MSAPSAEPMSQRLVQHAKQTTKPVTALSSGVLAITLSTTVALSNGSSETIGAHCASKSGKIAGSGSSIRS